MSLSTWWLFVIMTFFISATPGPNMILVMTSSARFGFTAAIATMAGCMSSLLAMMAISAAGLGAVLQAFPTVFDLVRLAGAGYLAYLGVSMWRAPTDAGPHLPENTRIESSARALYRQGVLVAASNPKAILFAAAFLPQFIHADAAQLPQFALLLATFAVIEISWYVLYASGGQRLASHLHKPAVVKLFNRLTGAAFVGFALFMADLRG